ncbi:MAG TPA: hypothetical protein VLV31_05530 [Candidatus Acidoferrales bacterium]|nr:hypothetical protein [Candidatus Acidoferrales bacterium]
MFRVRMPEFGKDLSAITCGMETLATRAKFMTGSMLFGPAPVRAISHPAQRTHYDPQRDLALLQVQLSRCNR